MKIHLTIRERNNTQIRAVSLVFSILLLLFGGILNAQTGRNLEEAYAQARQWGFDGQYDLALELCDSILSVNPDYYDTEILRTRITAWSGKLKSADSLVQQMEAKYNKNKEVVLLSATIKTWSEKHERAISTLENGLIRWKGDQELLIALGKSYLANGEEVKAIAIADSLRNSVPEKSLDLKVHALIGLQFYDSALTFCDTLIQLNDVPAHRTLRARVNALKPDYTAALVELDTVLGSDSTFVQAHYLRNNVFFWTGQNEDAVAGSNWGLSSHPNDISLLNQLAKGLLRIDSLSACDSVVQIVLESDSLNYTAWSVGLNSRLAQNDFDSVLNACDGLDTIYVADEELKRLRVLSYTGKKKYTKAIDAMAYDVSEVDSMDESSQVLYTKLHLWNREYNKSKKLVDRFLNINPESIRLLALKARILKGRYEKNEALAAVNEGLGIDSTDLELNELKIEIEKINLNELGGWLTYDFYSNSTSSADDRKAGQIEYMRRIKRHVVLGRLTVANRFDSTGIQGEIDFYPVVTDWLYFYSNIGASNNWLFPEFRAAVEPHFVLPATLVLSAGVRYMAYPGNDVIIFTGSINAYPGQFYLSLRPIYYRY